MLKNKQDYGRMNHGSYVHCTRFFRVLCNHFRTNFMVLLFHPSILIMGKGFVMNEFYFFQDMSFSDAAPVQYVLSSIEDTWAHWHKEIEILFLLSGELQITVDNTKCNLKTGDIILINSNQVHSIKGNKDLTYILQFVPEVISRIYGSEELYQFNLNTANVPFEKDVVGSIKSILAKIGIELIRKKEGYQFYLWSCVYELVGQIFRHCPYVVVKKGPKAEDLSKISMIINYITEHHAEILSIKAIAEALNMSDLTLSKFFREKTGLSVLFYLQIVRINHAKSLLKTEASIIDIAQDCGFYSLPTFYRTFKKITDISPYEFKKGTAHRLLRDDLKMQGFSGINYSFDTELLYAHLSPLLKA